MGVILTALFAVISANALWELLSILVSGIFGKKEKDMSDKYEITLSFGFSYPTIMQKVKREVT